LENTHDGKESNKMNVNYISGDLLDCQSAVISIGLLAHHDTSAFSNTQRSTQKSLTASIAFTSMHGDKSTP